MEAAFFSINGTGVSGLKVAINDSLGLHDTQFQDVCLAIGPAGLVHSGDYDAVYNQVVLWIFMVEKPIGTTIVR